MATHSFKIWGRRFALLVLSLLLAVIFLLTSNWGNRLLLNVATSAEPRLAISLDSGSLIFDPVFSQIRWQDQGIVVEQQHLAIAWDWSCLVESRLCIEAIELSGTRVKVGTLPPAEPTPPPAEPSGKIELPIAISLNLLNIRDLNLDIQGNHISWQQLQLALTLDQQGLILDPLRLDDLLVRLPTGADTTVQATKTAAASTAESSTTGTSATATDITQDADGKTTPAPVTLPEIELPDVVLPLDIYLRNIAINNTRIISGDTTQVISRLSLAAELIDSDINIQQLAVATPQADAKLNAQVTLAKDYPLTLQLNSQLKQPQELAGNTLRLDAGGSMADLNLQLLSQGPLPVELGASLSPLEPELPFDITLNWENISWPLSIEKTIEKTAEKGTETPAQVASPKGQLTAKGSLKQYQLLLNSQVSGQQIPATIVAVDATGDLSQLAIDRLSLDTLGGQVALNGQLGWSGGIDWQGQLQLTDINPGLQWPELPGLLNGVIASRFKAAEQMWQLDLDQLDIHGHLLDQPLLLSGKATGHSDGNWHIPEILLKSGDNHLEVAGQITKDLDLKGKIDAPALETSIPGLSGSVSSEFALTGNLEAPEIDYQLNADNLQYQQGLLKQLTSQGKMLLSRQPQGQLSLELDQGQWQTQQLKSIEINLSADDNGQQLIINADSQPLATQISLAGNWQAVDEKSTQAPVIWQGQLSDSWFKTPLGQWQLDKIVPLSFDTSQNQGQIDDHCWRSEDASLCLEQPLALGDSGNAVVNLSALPLARFNSLMPPSIMASGEVGARIQAGWGNNKRPNVKARIHSAGGTITVDNEPPALPGPAQANVVPDKHQIDYQLIDIDVELGQQLAQVAVQLDSTSIGNLNLNASVDPYQEDAALAGQVAMEGFTLQSLTPLLQQGLETIHQLAGEINLDGKLNGTLTQPLFVGELVVKDAALEADPLPTVISDLNTRISVDGNNANIEGSFLAGQGQAQLKGQVDWSQPAPTGWVSIVGDRLEIDHQSNIQLAVSPDLRLSMDETKMALSGQVTVPYGRIRLNELPDSAVSNSSDAIIIDQPQNTPKEKALPIELALKVIIRDDVKIDAFGLKADLAGNLDLQQRDKAALTGNGEVDLTNATYESYGQNLLIRKGQLLFTGPLDKPYLNIEAVRDPELTQDEVIAGLQVTGPAAQPKLVIFSEPALSQQRALSYLLRGRDLSSSDDTSTDDQLTAMLVGAGIGRSQQLVSSMGKNLGIKDLALNTKGAGGSTKVEVSGYIMPGVQIRYSVGVFNSQPEMALRYELMPNLFVEALKGAEEALDLFYKFDFE